MPVSNRAGHCFVERPLIHDSTTQRVVRYSEYRCPFGQTSSFASPCDPSRCSFIPILLGSRRPSAIPRSIGTVVVDSVKAVPTAWSWPHGLVKCQEVVSPLLSDCDTTSTIVSVTDVRGVIATAQGILPRIVLGLLAQTMNPCPSAHGFPPVAAATDGVAAAEIAGLRSYKFAAIAATHPDNGSSFSDSDSLNGGEPTEADASQVKRVTHSGNIARGDC